jgi:hypothetical protein
MEKAFSKEKSREKDKLVPEKPLPIQINDDKIKPEINNHLEESDDIQKELSALL